MRNLSKKYDRETYAYDLDAGCRKFIRLSRAERRLKRRLRRALRKKLDRALLTND